jgi:hypothetical protein
MVIGPKTGRDDARQVAPVLACLEGLRRRPGSCPGAPGDRSPPLGPRREPCGTGMTGGLAGGGCLPVPQQLWRQHATAGSGQGLRQLHPSCGSFKGSNLRDLRS